MAIVNFAELASYQYEEHPEAKEQKYKTVIENVSYYVECLDEQVKKNGGYLVGGHVTWADIFLFGVLDYLNFMAKFSIIEKAENLKALVAKVGEIPSIKAWVAKRPKTDC